MIVGLSGYAQSGKDTAAEVLTKRGFTRIAFADILRDMAFAIDPYVRTNTKADKDIVIFERLSSAIKNYGWDFAKEEFPDVRRLLQRLGTEAGREILGENIWVDTALNNAPENTVVTDVRFPNEVEGIEKRGGVVIRITRPGVGPKNEHASENSLEGWEWEYEIENDGSIQDLHDAVLSIVEQEYGL